MPLALAVVAILFIVVGYRGTQQQLFALLKGDFLGTHNFFYWVIAISVVGGIGYIPKFKRISDAFLVLLIIVLFIANKGFFAKFNSAIGTTALPQPSSSPSMSGSLTPLTALPPINSGTSIPQPISSSGGNLYTTPLLTAPLTAM